MRVSHSQCESAPVNASQPQLTLPVQAMLYHKAQENFDVISNVIPGMNENMPFQGNIMYNAVPDKDIHL